MPEISVIVPCYNQAHFLPTAVDSVLAQTFEDWELIIVNDGSTDDTAVVADQFDDPRITVIHQENRGLSGARNRGIAAANGQFVAFLDADDMWDRRFLQTCHSVLVSRKDVTAVFSGSGFMDLAGNILPQRNGRGLEPDLVRRRLMEGGFFPVHAALVRASCLDDRSFDERLTSAEDWDLWLRLTTHGRICGIPDVLAYYRIYPGSMSTDVERMRVNHLTIIDKLIATGHLSAEERSFLKGCAWRNAAWGYAQQGEDEQAWRCLQLAVKEAMDMALRVDTFYELALGAQPRGCRGTPLEAAAQARADHLPAHVDTVFRDLPSAARRRIRVTAHLAVALVLEQAMNWSGARWHLRSAMRYDSRLLRHYPTVRRYLKLRAGHCPVHYLARLQAVLRHL